MKDGTGYTVYMNAAVPELWQVICHVNDYYQMGMLGNYRVYASSIIRLHLEAFLLILSGSGQHQEQ